VAWDALSQGFKAAPHRLPPRGRATATQAKPVRGQEQFCCTWTESGGATFPPLQTGRRALPGSTQGAPAGSRQQIAGLPSQLVGFERGRMIALTWEGHRRQPAT